MGDVEADLRHVLGIDDGYVGPALHPSIVAQSAAYFGFGLKMDSNFVLPSRGQASPSGGPKRALCEPPLRALV